MKILVVDNGGQWTHREWRVLRYLKVDTSIIPNDTPFDEVKTDGLVLSGGSPRIGHESLKLGRCGEYLDNADFPILGICVGHQFIAMHYGGEAGPAKTPEYGKVEMVVDEENDILKGVPEKSQVWLSHNDEIKTLPDGFTSLAHSDSCKVQAFKYEKKPYYGTQFHPEVEHSECGLKVFENFVRICKEHK